MESETKFKVEELVEDMRQEAKMLTAGSKERSAAVDDMAKLLHVLNEEDRNANDFALKMDQMQEQDKDRKREDHEKKWMHGIAIATLGVTVVEIIKDVCCYRFGLKYEAEGGSIFSKHVNTFTQKLFRKHDLPKIK